MADKEHAATCVWKDERRTRDHAGPCMSKRDFECCAYKSKSGKTGCGALRYYHDEPHMKKRHAFVEPERTASPVEIITALATALKVFIPTCIKGACPNPAPYLSSMSGARLCDRHKSDSCYLVDEIQDAMSALTLAEGESQ